MKTGKPAITFRFAERGDCALILRFIRELAVYEHMNPPFSDEIKHIQYAFGFLKPGGP